MSTITWTLKKVKASELKPNIKNPKKRDEDGFQRLKKSLEKFGKVFDGIANADYQVIDGHSRLELADPEEDLMFFFPSRKLSKKEYLEMNAMFDEAKAGTTDMQIVEEIFTEAQMEEWGLDKTIPDAVEDEFEVPEGRIETDIVLGDLFEIGDHKLLCGDSTQKETFQKLFNDKTADLVITDPPYNVDYEGKTKKKLTIENDSMSNDVFYQFLLNFYVSLAEHTKPGAAWYVWHADSEGANFRLAMKNAGIMVKQCLIWVKQTMVMGRQDYQWRHEPCLYGWKEGAAHNWYSDRKQTTVLNFDRPQRSEEHPTMKPIPLFAYQIGNSSKQGDIVADGFGGSGTTMVACHQMNRRAYLVEFDPKYCQVIIDRMLKLDPSLIVKKNGKRI